MITHVVLMQFKDENKQANMREAIARLRAMVGKVESLRALDVGLHAGPPGPRALDLALTARFDDVAGLEAYAEHPVHVAVKDFLAGVLEASYVVDYASEHA